MKSTRMANNPLERWSRATRLKKEQQQNNTNLMKLYYYINIPICFQLYCVYCKSFSIHTDRVSLNGSRFIHTCVYVPRGLPFPTFAFSVRSIISCHSLARSLARFYSMLKVEPNQAVCMYSNILNFHNFIPDYRVVCWRSFRSFRVLFCYY